MALFVGVGLSPVSSCGRPAAPTSPFRSISLPKGSGPAGVCVATDGAAWLTLRDAGRLVRVPPRPPFAVETIRLPRADSEPVGIASGPDGNVWLVEARASRIARVQAQWPYTVTEWATPCGRSWPERIEAGADGELWFTQKAGLRVGRVRTIPRVEISEIDLPPPSCGQPEPSCTHDVTTSTDGGVWVSRPGPGLLCRLVRGGPFTDVACSSVRVGGHQTPTEIVAGIGGTVWFTTGGGVLGRFTPPWDVTVVPFEPGYYGCGGVAMAPDGSVWLTAQGALWEVPAGARSEPVAHPLPEPSGRPGPVAVGADGIVWLVDLRGPTLLRFDPALAGRDRP